HTITARDSELPQTFPTRRSSDLHQDLDHAPGGSRLVPHGGLAAPVQRPVRVLVDDEYDPAVLVLRRLVPVRRLAHKPVALCLGVVPEACYTRAGVGGLDLGDAADDRDHDLPGRRGQVDRVVLGDKVLPVLQAPVDHGAEVREATYEAVQLPEEDLV